MMMKFFTILSLLAGLASTAKNQVYAFNYNITSAGSLYLIDVGTTIPGIVSIFTNEATDVEVQGIEWAFTGEEGGDTSIAWQTFVNGVLQVEGTFSLEGVERELPTSIQCGTITISSSKFLLQLLCCHGYYFPSCPCCRQEQGIIFLSKKFAVIRRFDTQCHQTSLIEDHRVLHTQTKIQSQLILSHPSMLHTPHHSLPTDYLYTSKVALPPSK
jgi:hypothetical protein